MIILLKASLIIIVLFAFYKLLLEKESFFAANRMYLLSCLALSCILPFLVFPKMFQHQGYVDQLLAEYRTQEIAELDNDSELATDIIKPPKVEAQNEESAPQESIMLPEENETIAEVEDGDNVMLEPIVVHPNNNTKGVLFWLFLVYLFGVIVLIIRLVGQLFNVGLKIIRNDDKIENEGTIIVNLQDSVEPCSFFNYIFITPSNYDFDTYEQIIEHEKIHVSKKHTLDLLLSEIAIIVLWFNPFVWLFRKEIEKNIEYQTDETLIKKESDIKETYQLNLVKIACEVSPLAITTNYNQSLIKQRILRMNSKKSNPFSYWKYAFCLPLIFTLALVLNQPFEAMATPNKIENTQVEPPGEIESENNPQSSESEPTKNEIDQKSDEQKTANIPSKPINEPIVLDSKSIADCEEFEKAVAAGDLVRVKEILKTLDPDCLKIKKNEKSNLNAVQNLVKKKKSELKGKKKFINEEGSPCERLQDVVRMGSVSKARDIMQNEDISCLLDENGNPSQDMSLLKGLLSYGSNIRIYGESVVRIDEISFIIGVDDEEAVECKDPNYLKLVTAIKEDNEQEIRRILKDTDLSCPLNVNGIRNDFIFIKELMAYYPIIENHDRKAITVGGVGLEMDLSYFNQSSDEISSHKESKSNQKGILEDIEKNLKARKERVENATCLDLINAIAERNHSLSTDLADRMEADCFHRESTTITDGEDQLTVTHVTTPLLAAIRIESKSLVIQLLDKGADVNYSGGGKETPLIAAAKTGNKEITKILVEGGAEMNRTDKANFTALDYAISQKNDDLADFLIRHGAR